MTNDRVSALFSRDISLGRPRLRTWPVDYFPGAGGRVNENVETLDGLLRRLIREVVAEVVREEMRERDAAPRRGPGETEFVSVRKAASMAGVNPSSIRTWIAKGWIPGYRAGRLTRVRIPDLIGFMASGPPRDERMITPDAIVAEIVERQRKRG